MAQREYLDYMVPIRMVGMTWVLLAAIFFLPNAWWGIVLKIILGIGILIIFKSSLSPMWDRYASLGAFTVLNTLFLGAILWFNHVTWVVYLAITLIIIALATQLNHIAQYNKPTK